MNLRCVAVALFISCLKTFFCQTEQAAANVRLLKLYLFQHFRKWYMFINETQLKSHRRRRRHCRIQQLNNFSTFPIKYAYFIYGWLVVSFASGKFIKT